MTGLLVSVKDAREAKVALDAGVDLIDMKDPSQPLGRCEPNVWHAVRQVTEGQRPLSAALGELLVDFPCPPVPPGTIDFAKVGLAGAADESDWKQMWSAAMRRLPAGVAHVGVAYVDHERAKSPPVDHVLAAAAGFGCRALLLDTFDKQHGSLFDHLSTQEIGSIILEARQRSLLTVLGGSLRQATLSQAIRLGPDYVAVRGAVCAGTRDETLSALHLAEVVQQVADMNALRACRA